MAELILSPIARKIIDVLGSAAVKEIALLWGVHEELDELEQTISIINAVLVDAEQKQVHNNVPVKIWLERLGGVVDDADNLMDEINTEALRRKVMSGNEMAKKVRTFFSGSNQLASRFKMSSRIKGIKKKLEAISRDRRDLGLEVRREENQVVRRVRDDTHSFVRQENVIGRDEDRMAIIKLLLEDETEIEENVLVIAIVGMGGLGKTTLAQSVFNDEKVQKHFELKIWVCVAENFDLKLIIQKVIKSITGNNNLGDIEMDQLQKDLRKELGGKRYLLILDDVWEESREKWLKLEDLLISSDKGSRVVVTTRSNSVARITAGTRGNYQLGILNEEQSWSLFKKVAFEQGQEPKNSNIVNIGREILEKCRGIPLAIKTIGNLLYGKNSESMWSSFNKEFSKISQQKEDDILPTLKLSYDHLASHLKRCFAYCGLFPKDYKIEVETLVKLWMAQGFLKLSDASQDQCLEDVGYEYFVNLLEGSFFQEVKLDEWRVITSCKMHDLMHDLAIIVAGAECATLSFNFQGNIQKSTHHVSFERKIKPAREIPTSLVQASKIKTILSPNYDEGCFANESICDAVISNFKLIRSLDFNRSSIKLVPNFVGKLKHLRYLDLSGNSDLKALPNSITSLLNLETLKLSDCGNLRELPRDIGKLINLRHLEIDHCNELNHMPCGIGQLTKLQTLSTYVLISKNTKPVQKHGGGLKELKGLNNLRGELRIVNLRDGKDVEAEYESAKLKDKQFLRSLELEWDSSNVEIDEAETIVGYEVSMDALQPHPNLQKLTLSEYRGVQLSSWLPSLTNLVHLTLSVCTKCQYLVPLNQFHHLKRLYLIDLESLEYISNSNGNDVVFDSAMTSAKTLLPSLECLWLRRLPNLKGWWSDVVDNSFGANANEENHIMLLPYFPSLSLSFVNNCPKLTCMPLYPHLEKGLILENTSSKPFEETVMMSPTTSSFSPLSKLTSLSLGGIEDLEYLPDWLKSLTSLETLNIWNCSKLKDLCPGILHLSSLRDLSIYRCEELGDMLNGDDHTFMWKALNGRLRSLSLWGLPEVLKALPKCIQHLTTLQKLHVYYSDSLTTIPEWIENLQSLERLQFYYCSNLTSLPEGIRSLTSLKSLWIEECPNLSKRCQRDIGEDWHKISHIQQLDLWPDPNKVDKNSSEHPTELVSTRGCNIFNKFGLCNIKAKNQAQIED